MENEQVFYKIDLLASKYSDICKVIATRSTEKTIWFMRNNHEQRELLRSSYYQYCTSEDHAKAIIDSRNKAKAEKDEQKRISKAAPALLEALESARAFIYRHAQTDCNTGKLICKKTEAELIKIDAAIAAARGEV